MPLTPEEAKEQISQLVANYKRSADDERQRLSEADVQASYIDRLFLALGWNVYNDPNQETAYHRQGYIRGAGMVDVGMEIASKPVLMQEAKRFGIIGESRKRTSDRTLEEKQVFRYARGRGIPHAILSNFERTLVFNADHERLILSFDSPDEYLSRVEDLLLLSPEKIKAGSLQWKERQTGIKDVDEAFLESMRDWRLKLANAIHKHNAGNPELQTNGSFDFHRLMMAVQRILDRLMLIRYADDKEVLLRFDLLENILDHYRRMGPYAKPDHLVQQFLDLSRMMDQHHNTKLFQPGHICEKVNIPNDVLATVMEEMNNISFRKFTSDILGATYESYLATRLALKNGEIVSQEQKETRKKGGIYYTPSWVVHYIVDNALGKLLNELEAQHGIKAIEKAAALRVLDPACGSGSFLIYAYQVFANFYRKMNKAIDEERVKLITPVAGPDMFQRMEMLKNTPEPVIDYPQYILSKHLYGVDIDPEAAEIAAVNLTMTAFADSRKEKLPLILDENIKVGNSLISGTEEELKKYFVDAWRDKRPFNWEDEFPDIMQGGGFDVVVGNPPYVQLSMEPSLELGLQLFLLETYGLSMGRLNTFGFFTQRGINLLKQGGFLSYIIPNTFLTQEYYRELRKFVLDTCQVIVMATLEGMPFKRAVVENIIAVLRKETDEKVRESNNVSIIVFGRDQQRHIPQNAFSSSYNYAFTINVSDGLATLRNKVDNQSTRLHNLVNINQAIALKHARANSLFKVSRGEEYKKVLDGRDISRYAIHWPGTYLLYDIKKIHSCKREDIFLAGEKILFRRVGDRIVAALDAQRHYALNTLVVVTPKSQEVNLNFILALMNSKMLNWYYMFFLKSTKKVFSEIQARQIEQLPIRKVELDSPRDRKLHDDLLVLVNRMLGLNNHQASLSKVSKDWQDLELEINQIDAQIDSLVYDLYGLTEEERQIVERETGKQ